MELARQFIADASQPPETIAQALSLLEESLAARDESDGILKRHARHWELDRLALVDRNILRLAVFEMLSKRAPPKVIIAESLRLAEEFSTAESPRFVNGILDAVYKELYPDPSKTGTHNP